MERRVTKPKVINLRYEKPNTSGPDADTVYVGRGSPFGNPFQIGKDGTREQVIMKYGAYLYQHPELVDAAKYLEGMNLACWCAPLPCHADILLAIANGEKA